MLFLWLYPGGNGDFNESHSIDITVKDWAIPLVHLMGIRHGVSML
jgi:hypothetical protein